MNHYVLLALLVFSGGLNFALGIVVASFTVVMRLTARDPERGLTELLGGVRHLRGTLWYVGSDGRVRRVRLGWNNPEAMASCVHAFSEVATLPDGRRVCATCGHCLPGVSAKEPSPLLTRDP